MVEGHIMVLDQIMDPGWCMAFLVFFEASAMMMVFNPPNGQDTAQWLLGKRAGEGLCPSPAGYLLFAVLLKRRCP